MHAVIDIADDPLAGPDRRKVGGRLAAFALRIGQELDDADARAAMRRMVLHRHRSTASAVPALEASGPSVIHISWKVNPRPGCSSTFPAGPSIMK